MPITLITSAKYLEYTDDKADFTNEKFNHIAKLIINNKKYPNIMVSSPFLATVQTTNKIAELIKFPYQIIFDNAFGDFSDAVLNPQTLFLKGIRYPNAGANSETKNIEYNFWLQQMLNSIDYYNVNFPTENIWIITHPAILKALFYKLEKRKIKTSEIKPLTIFHYDKHIKL